MLGTFTNLEDTIICPLRRVTLKCPSQPREMMPFELRIFFQLVRNHQLVQWLKRTETLGPSNFSYLSEHAVATDASLSLFPWGSSESYQQTQGGLEILGGICHELSKLGSDWCQGCIILYHYMPHIQYAVCRLIVCIDVFSTCVWYYMPLWRYI